MTRFERLLEEVHPDSVNFREDAGKFAIVDALEAAGITVDSDQHDPSITFSLDTGERYKCTVQKLGNGEEQEEDDDETQKQARDLKMADEVTEDDPAIKSKKKQLGNRVQQTVSKLTQSLGSIRV